ncbi:hypothetical protein Tco_0606275 [Tanacetum coccineum]
MSKGNEIIAINLDSSSDNSSSDSDNNTSDSASTSQISICEEIDYDSPEYKGPPKSLLKWYGYLSDEYKDNCSHVPITNCVLGLANATTWDAILSKTFGLKIPPTMACAEEKKGKRNISRGSWFYFFMYFEIIVLSSDSSDDRKGSLKASVPIFEGPSVQGLLDHYGYNDIEEYLSWNYFPSTDKDITDEDCIHESNYAMSKGKYVLVSQKYKPKVKSPVPVAGCMLGLANVTTWDEIVNKIGVRKSEIYVDKAKGKRKVSYGS